MWHMLALVIAVLIFLAVLIIENLADSVRLRLIAGGLAALTVAHWLVRDTQVLR